MLFCLETEHEHGLDFGTARPQGRCWLGVCGLLPVYHCRSPQGWSLFGGSGSARGVGMEDSREGQRRGNTHEIAWRTTTKDARVYARTLLPLPAPPRVPPPASRDANETTREKWQRKGRPEDKGQAQSAVVVFVGGLGLYFLWVVYCRG
jgi:hypothetical protein